MTAKSAYDRKVEILNAGLPEKDWPAKPHLMPNGIWEERGWATRGKYILWRGEWYTHSIDFENMNPYNPMFLKKVEIEWRKTSIPACPRKVT